MRTVLLRALPYIVSPVVGAIFVYAAAEKLQSPQKFADQLRNYRMLPLGTINAVALLMPWWEGFAGLAIAVPVARIRRPGAIVIVVLLLAFLIAVTQGLARGLDIECGCFGTGSSKLGWKVLAIDLALLTGAWLVLADRPSRLAERPTPSSNAEESITA